jgi:transcription termination factor Rho
MSVLDRSALEASPLADLHAVASELSIDGYRRLRRADLVSAILDKQGGGESTAETEPAEEKAPRRTRSRRSPAAEKEPEAEAEPAASDEAPESNDADEDGEDGSATRRRRGRRGGRGRPARGEETPSSADRPAARGDETPARGDKSEARSAGKDDGDDRPVEGVVELLAGGSGFVRINPPEPSDADVYISSAQVKRCELVSGDRVSGPKRPPRRSERYASLIRIETINGRPASELADSIRFEDLPAAFPSEHLELGSDDPTLKAIDALAPFGKGSRVSIVGPARSGKTEALKRVANLLHEREGLTVHLVLAGVRPEEITEWTQGPIAPVAAAGLTATEETQNGAVEAVIDQAKRLAARGADAVVLIDCLDGCSPSVARRALGAARNIVDGGSVTVIATRALPVGGETTVIALDGARAAVGKYPALDPFTTGVLRADVLVGDSGAKAILRARDKAIKAEQK